MDKLVIVGIDSLAGANLGLTLAQRCDVVGISRGRDFEIDGRPAVRVAAGSPTEVAEAVATANPDWVVYCGKAARSRWDSSGPAGAGVELAELKGILRAIGAGRCRFTLITSDALFTGPRLFHSEVSDGAKNDAAARAARQMEQVLDPARSLVVRTHLFGWSPGGDSFAECVWEALSAGGPVAASGAIYCTPILASDFAELLYRAFRKELRGVYHLAGAERASAWQFATALAAAGGLPGRVECAPAVIVGSKDSARACHDETSLDSRKIQRTLSTALPMLRDGLNRFVEQGASGYRERMGDSAVNRLVTAAA